MTQDVTAAARDDRRAAILSRFYRVFFYFLCRVQSSPYSVYKYWIEEKNIYIIRNQGYLSIHAVVAGGQQLI